MKTTWEHDYLDLLRRALTTGERRDDRTGTGTLSLFGERIIIPSIDGAFPAMTTKKLYWHGVVGELLWFLRGETNVGWLEDRRINIWSAWADDDGELGPVYGRQWRDWNGYDQIARLIESINGSPSSRRHIVSAWNVDDLDGMAIPPCHAMAQWYVRGGRYLDCQLYQRSADLFLGVPFNIASYSLLTAIVAKLTALTPGRLIHTMGDAHIYSTHVDQVEEQLHRQVMRHPQVMFTWMAAQDAIGGTAEPDEFKLVGYKSHPAIPAPIAV